MIGLGFVHGFDGGFQIRPRVHSNLPEFVARHLATKEASEVEVWADHVTRIRAALAAGGFVVGARGTVQHVVTPADRELATGVPGGSAYGPVPHSLRGALLRSATAQPTPGLFHIGASARPGAGLPYAALSGWHAAELIKLIKQRSAA